MQQIGTIAAGSAIGHVAGAGISNALFGGRSSEPAPQAQEAPQAGESSHFPRAHSSGLTAELSVSHIQNDFKGCQPCAFLVWVFGLGLGTGTVIPGEAWCCQCVFGGDSPSNYFAVQRPAEHLKLAVLRTGRCRSACRRIRRTSTRASSILTCSSSAKVRCPPDPCSFDH